MRKILLFQYRDICYSSFLYFTQCLKREFEQLGADVEVCSFTMETLHELERYIGKSFDMIIDFNSILPGAVIDTGEYLLDKINAPFYNYLLDHPLYHHEYLKVRLQNYRAICIDRDHATYVKHYYSHISKVLFLPLGGMGESEETYAEQKYKVSLSGTYTSEEKIKTIINDLETDMSQRIYDLIDIMQSDFTCTFERAMKRLIEEKYKHFPMKNFAQAMHFHFLADMYSRAKSRHQVIEKIVSSGIELHVLGHGYDEYHGKGRENLIMHGAATFSESFQFIRQSRISLNVLPGFKDGAHDRIFSAMLNRSVVLTDNSIYLNQKFTHEKDILFYDIKELDNLPEIIKNSLSTETILEQIRNNAYHKVKLNHTWKNRCIDLLYDMD